MKRRLSKAETISLLHDKGFSDLVIYQDLRLVQEGNHCRDLDLEWDATDHTFIIDD